jgi:hypothetical protein
MRREARGVHALKDQVLEPLDSLLVTADTHNVRAGLITAQITSYGRLSRYLWVLADRHPGRPTVSQCHHGDCAISDMYQLCILKYATCILQQDLYVLQESGVDQHRNLVSPASVTVQIEKIQRAGVRRAGNGRWRRYSAPVTHRGTLAGAAADSSGLRAEVYTSRCVGGASVQREGWDGQSSGSSRCQDELLNVTYGLC